MDVSRTAVKSSATSSTIMRKAGVELGSLVRSIQAKIRSAESLAALRAAWNNEPISPFSNCPAYDKPPRSQPGVNLMPFLFYVRIFIERTMAVHLGIVCGAVKKI